jgi:DDE superfamily endonuclease
MNDTEKLEPQVICKSKQPPCFKSAKRLPVFYEANKTIWMTGDIWANWLKGTDELM